MNSTTDLTRTECYSMFKCSHHVAASGVTGATRAAAPNLTDGAAAEVVNPAL